MSSLKGKSDSKKKGKKIKMKERGAENDDPLLVTSSSSSSIPPAKRAKLDEQISTEDSVFNISQSNSTAAKFLMTWNSKEHEFERSESSESDATDSSEDSLHPESSSSILNIRPMLYASGIQSYLEESFSSSSESHSDASCNSDLCWVWDEASLSKACCLAKSKSEVKFHMNYSCGTATARSTEGFADGQIYWEIKMISPVYGTDMMIGIGTEKIHMDQYMTHFCSMLGIDVQGESCGLSYSGHFYYGGSRKLYCNKFGQSTVIGIHLDLWKGTLSYYKNGKCLGVACKGLNGKEWFPMVSSTAASTSMRLIRTESFPSSLQFLCCKELRQAVPPDLNVLDVLEMPPGLKIFLKNNLSWLLNPFKPKEEVNQKTQGTQTLLSIGAKKMKKSFSKVKSSLTKWKKD